MEKDHLVCVLTKKIMDRITENISGLNITNRNAIFVTEISTWKNLFYSKKFDHETMDFHLCRG